MTGRLAGGYVRVAAQGCVWLCVLDEGLLRTPQFLIPRRYL